MTDEMPKGAERISKDLDLLIDLDEPDSFVWRAINLIHKHAPMSRKWSVVRDALMDAEAQLKKLNEPSQKSVTDETKAEE